jgi:hypothetical protein
MKEAETKEARMREATGDMEMGTSMCSPEVSHRSRNGRSQLRHKHEPAQPTYHGAGGLYHNRRLDRPATTSRRD